MGKQHAPKMRMGRPKVTPAAPASAAKPVAAKPSKPLTRAPRGALPAAVKEVLVSNGGPMTLVQIRDAVMKTEHFRKANPKGLYSQVTEGVKKVGKKTPKGWVASN